VTKHIGTGEEDFALKVFERTRGKKVISPCFAGLTEFETGATKGRKSEFTVKGPALIRIRLAEQTSSFVVRSIDGKIIVLFEDFLKRRLFLRVLDGVSVGNAHLNGMLTRWRLVTGGRFIARIGMLINRFFLFVGVFGGTPFLSRRSRGTLSVIALGKEPLKGILFEITRLGIEHAI
jgi:hypothetical protein